MIDSVMVAVPLSPTGFRSGIAWSDCLGARQVIIPIGLAGLAMNFWVELVQHRADDGGSDRLELLLRPPYLMPVSGAGIDDQENSIDNAGEQQRVVGRQYRRRVDEHDAKSLANRPEGRSSSRPVDSRQDLRRPPARGHDAQSTRYSAVFEQLDGVDDLVGFRIAFENLGKAHAVDDTGGRCQPTPPQIAVDQQHRLTGKRGSNGKARGDSGL